MAAVILPFLATAFIWGSTWYVITLQFGVVAPIVSVAWRFLLAGGLLLAWCAVRRYPLHFSLRAHGLLLLQGTTLFGINYWLFYEMESLVVSAFAAIVFALIIPLNALNARWLLGKPLDKRVLVGGIIGISGVALLFFDEIMSTTAAAATIVTAIGLGVVATCSASIGNIIATRNRYQGARLAAGNAWAMSYGGAVITVIAAVSGTPFTFDWSATYLLALLYLAIIGSIVAFALYINLLVRIGPDRGAYIALLVPVIAVGFSSIFETFHWSIINGIGLVAIITGNGIALRKRRADARHTHS